MFVEQKGGWHQTTATLANMTESGYRTNPLTKRKTNPLTKTKTMTMKMTMKIATLAYMPESGKNRTNNAKIANSVNLGRGIHFSGLCYPGINIVAILCVIV